MSEYEIDGRRVRDVPCPLCGGAEREPRFAKHGFTWVRCAACTLVYVTPRLTKESIGSIYAQGFAGKDESKPAPIDDSSFRPILRTLERLGARGRLLDVGCFTGHFLSAAARQGYEVEGTEICAAAARRAREAVGCVVHEGELAELALEEGRYDAITMLDVLEHLSDPVADLERVSKWLRPGGILYLETPNFDALARRRFGKRWCVFFPWHLTYFTRKTLRLIAERSGFDLLAATSEDLGPWSANDPYFPGHGRAPKPGRRRRLRSFLLRQRRWLKPIYRRAKRAWNVPLHLSSALSYPLGAKLVAVLARPRELEATLVPRRAAKRETAREPVSTR